MAELPIALAELPGAKITARVNRTAGAAVNDQTTVTIIEPLTRNVDGLNMCKENMTPHRETNSKKGVINDSTEALNTAIVCSRVTGMATVAPATAKPMIMAITCTTATFCAIFSL